MHSQTRICGSLCYSVSVRLGEHNVKTDEDCEGDTPGLAYCSDPPVDVEIEEIINHKSLVHDEHIYADIALLTQE